MEDRKKFLEDRKGSIGASEAGAVYNLGYGCSRRVCYDKRGEPRDFPDAETAAQERGNMLEPVARAMYEKRSGRAVKLVSQAHDPAHPWMSVHMDGATTAPTKEGHGYVELKVLHWSQFKKIKREGQKEEYILQLQHGIAVTGWQWGSFGILCPEPWDFLWFDIDRDQALIDTLTADEEELWRKVEHGPLPDPLDPTDRRCHECPWRKTCHGDALLNVIPKDERSAELPEDNSLGALVVAYEEAKQLEADAAEIKDEAHAALAEAIGDRPGAAGEGYRIYYREFPIERWETKALNAEMKSNPVFAALMKNYKRVTSQRPLKVYAL